MSVETVIREFLLAHFLELLEEQEGVETKEQPVSAPRIWGQIAGDGTRTGRQSNLRAAPGTGHLTQRTNGQSRAIGNTKRHHPTPIEPPKGSPVVVLPTPYQPVATRAHAALTRLDLPAWTAGFPFVLEGYEDPQTGAYRYLMVPTNEPDHVLQLQPNLRKLATSALTVPHESWGTEVHPGGGEPLAYEDAFLAGLRLPRLEPYHTYLDPFELINVVGWARFHAWQEFNAADPGAEAFVLPTTRYAVGNIYFDKTVELLLERPKYTTNGDDPVAAVFYNALELSAGDVTYSSSSDFTDRDTFAVMMGNQIYPDGATWFDPLTGAGLFVEYPYTRAHHDVDLAQVVTAEREWVQSVPGYEPVAGEGTVNKNLYGVFRRGINFDLYGAGGDGVVSPEDRGTLTYRFRERFEITLRPVWLYSHVYEGGVLTLRASLALSARADQYHKLWRIRDGGEEPVTVELGNGPESEFFGGVYEGVSEGGVLRLWSRLYSTKTEAAFVPEDAPVLVDTLTVGAPPATIDSYAAANADLKSLGENTLCTVWTPVLGLAPKITEVQKRELIPFYDGLPEVPTAESRADVSSYVPYICDQPDLGRRLANPLGVEGTPSIFYGLEWTTPFYTADTFRADVPDADGNLVEHLFAVAIVNEAGAYRVLVSRDSVPLGSWPLMAFFPLSDGTLKDLEGNVWDGVLRPNYNFLAVGHGWPYRGAGYISPFTVRVRSRQDRSGQFYTAEAAGAPVTLHYTGPDPDAP